MSSAAQASVYAVAEGQVAGGSALGGPIDPVRTRGDIGFRHQVGVEIDADELPATFAIGVPEILTADLWASRIPGECKRFGCRVALAYGLSAGVLRLGDVAIIRDRIRSADTRDGRRGRKWWLTAVPTIQEARP